MRRLLVLVAVTGALAVTHPVEGQVAITNVGMQMIDLGSRSNLYNEVRVKATVKNEGGEPITVMVEARFLNAEGFEVADLFFDRYTLQPGDSVNVTDVANVFKDAWREIVSVAISTR